MTEKEWQVYERLMKSARQPKQPKEPEKQKEFERLAPSELFKKIIGS